MKHDEMRSVAHNLADSLASGCGLMISVFGMDVFGEACRSNAGYLDVDFLSGTVIGSQVSTELAYAIVRYKDALPALCAKQGGRISDFAKLVVRYSMERGVQRYLVTVIDANGRMSESEYWNGRRLKQVDERGRVRVRPILRGRLAVTARVV